MITLTNKESEALTDIMSKYSFPFFLEKAFDVVQPAYDYVHNWHIDAICDYLHAMSEGSIKRLIINIAPRSLKSITCSIAFPAFRLGHNPQERFIVASYGDTLVKDLSIDTKKVMGTDWYKKMFPDTLIARGQNEKHYFHTTLQGFRRGVVVGGQITGAGADWIIIDDPMSPEEAYSDAQRNNANRWISQTLMSRDNGGNSAKIVCIMQRLHENDTTGLFKEMGDFEHLVLPAEFTKKVMIVTPKRAFEVNAGEVLNEKLHSKDYLNTKRKSLREWAYACQYLQSPAPLEGGLVQKSSLKWYDNDTKPAHFKILIHSWDTAFTVTTSSAYSACTIWGVTVKGLYLLQVINERLDSTDLDQKVRKLADRDKPYRILIENKASGIGLIQRLQRTTMLPIQSINVGNSNKVERFTFAKDYIDTGKVYLPTNTFWLNDYLQQILTFPNSAFADMVDSTSQFCKWFHENERYLLDLIGEPEYLYNNFDELSDSNIRETYNYTGY